MKSSIQYSKLLLATLVIACFAFVGIAIAYRNFWLAFTALFIGFLVMGYGLSLKRKKQHKQETLN
ncbi:DUF5325 family protein [Aquibacillus rhizosphaerae]|uniref:DUF5325 family protein n=1 Tax=Aquibacillus rhizosphaerae TaxID=3051431 RepID=A0ABT7L7Y0_9BACI|nr:DUF5325 family protein [Aquibacillus sp. LR5S19]MDL4841310.1 DUF5325 family protein [Aquibacillus sp. LR5S19]